MRKRAIIIGIILLVLISVGCVGTENGEPIDDTYFLDQVEKEMLKPQTIESTITSAPITTTSAAVKDETTTEVQALFESKCSYCHSIDRAKSKKKTRSGWEVTVKRMQDVNGARAKAGLTDEEAEKIIDYLAETYGN